MIDSLVQDVEFQANLKKEIHHYYEIMYHLNPSSPHYFYYKGKMDAMIQVQYMIYYNDDYHEYTARPDKQY